MSGSAVPGPQGATGPQGPAGPPGFAGTLRLLFNMTKYHSIMSRRTGRINSQCVSFAAHSAPCRLACMESIKILKLYYYVIYHESNET